MKKVESIIEKNDGLLWGRIEDKGNFSPNGAGVTTEALIIDIKPVLMTTKNTKERMDFFGQK